MLNWLGFCIARHISLIKTHFYIKIVKKYWILFTENLAQQRVLLYEFLDADSEGQEGKYYTWEKGTLQSLLKNDYELFADYYNLDSKVIGKIINTSYFYD